MILSSALALVLAAGQAQRPHASAAPAPPPGMCLDPDAVAAGRATAAEARRFVARANEDLKRLDVRLETASWIQQTYLTYDTDRAAAWATEELQAYLNQAAKDAMRFEGVKGIDPETARALHLLRVASSLPAPSDPAKRAQLAELATRLESTYGKGKWCGKDGKGPCRDLDQLSETMRRSRSWDELLDAWVGWHTISTGMRGDYAKLVDLANAGAREIGFHDVGELWRSGYDMSPAELVRETDRLWAQVKPLYDDLHCYVRGKLQERYGKERVPDGKPIPAHLLGDMWAQQWGNIYPEVAPGPAAARFDVEAAMKAKGYDPLKMVKLGEAFFTSLGLDPLPATFWERSLFTRPRDREVVCHASAWDMGGGDDLRVKMCLRVNEDDLQAVHHELGHDYYMHAYRALPELFRQGANEGFHEAIGDTIALSVTPAYLKRVGILDAVPPRDRQGTVAVLLRQALDKVAFLPFGVLMDEWRWGVFSGKIPPSRYEAAWIDLRRKLQGVDAPVPRTEADFDPGAKYHIASNTPYLRYFLAHVYQFQFQRALCKAAGHRGPLHTCSIYGSAEAGRRLEAMMELGASRPWQDAMALLTGQRRADATALLDYFAPLDRWLKEQNRGKKCGW